MPFGYVLLGLVQGSLAGINSLGLIVLWRTSRVMNIAQPSMGLVGGVLVGLLVVVAGWSFWWALPVGLLVGATLGFLADRVALRRLHDAPRAVLVVATVGLAQVFGALQTALPFAFGGRLPSYSIDLGVSWTVHPVVLLGPHILALAALPLALGLAWWFVHRSRVGLAALALGQDAERARALGVPAQAVRSAVWAFAGVLATISGTLSIPVLGFNIGGGLGSTVLLLALAPAVFAGLRSLPAAAAASLALGVAYQWALRRSDDAGVAQLMLAGAVLAALALQRRRLGRSETAMRASSWEAAATPRPIPWRLASSNAVRTFAPILVVVAIGAAAAPALFLPPGSDVLYATAAAIAIGSLSVAVLWMFTGEIAVGHWGFAGFGAAIAAFTPGPWFVRAGVASVAMTLVGAALATTSRRQSGLSFAVIGFAAAASSPVAVGLGRLSIDADPRTMGSVTAAVAVVLAIVVARVRSSRAGLRMIAARDDPDRAPWLGANPPIARVAGIAMSTGLAGLAGALYMSSTALSGVAPGAFDFERSLDVLAMAVIGGLGSPVGALIGAGAMQAARLLLPDWGGLLVSGLGIIVVVSFLPAGLGGLIARGRDAAARLIAGPGPHASPPSSPDDLVRDPGRGRVPERTGS